MLDKLIGGASTPLSMTSELSSFNLAQLILSIV